MSKRTPATPATQDEMDKLHNEFAKELGKRLKNGEKVTVAGETRTVAASAAVLNVIRGFLKDNNVLCAEGHPSRPVGQLSRDLEEFNKGVAEEDGAPQFKN